MKFKNKKFAAFGCYGWSGESVKVINELMTDAGFEKISDGYRAQWNPDKNAKQKAVELGRQITNIK